ncbi:MAG: matrixin family metalloprotease [Candidatus Binatia bacterium]
MRSPALSVALLLTLAVHAAAYTIPVENHNGTFVRRRWPASAQPIQFQINDQTGPQLPNVAPGSDPLGVLARAMTRWPAVSAIRFQQGPMTQTTDAGCDGENIITFANTAANQMTFEMAGGDAVVGLTIHCFNPDSEDYAEADVLFNPNLQFTTTLNTDADLAVQNMEDIEATAAHELGHVTGLHHSGIESATMWPIVSVLQRHLDADDIAGARTLYPVTAPSGTVSGTVTVNSQPGFGAQVVALRSSGQVAASALTLPDGTYAIESLPPDTYTLYVEPLDGPMAAVPDGTCVLVGNLNGAGIYRNATLTTNFPTMFLGGNDTPAALVLTAGSTMPANFTLPSGANPINPTVVGPATVTPGGTSWSVSTRPLGIMVGADQFITVGGPHVDQTQEISIDGPGVTVDSSSVMHQSIMCGGATLPVLIFHATVAADAAPGGRAILLRAGAAVSTMTAAVDVLAPPCTGDCNEDGVVTVDELLTMVNIALGNATIAQCQAGDANGDGHITVDEILTAVNNALNGCGSR